MYLNKINPIQLEDEIIDFKAYWKVLMKSKWKILGFSFLTTFLVVIYVLGIPPIYRATASLLLDSDQNKTVSIDTVYSLDTSRKEYFLTQYEILKSRAVTEEVIDKLKLAFNPEFLPKENNDLLSLFKGYIKGLLPIKAEKVNDEEFNERSAKVALIDAVQSRLSITPVPKTQLVNIAFEANDPKLAALVANTIGDTYIRRGMSAQLNSTKKAADWIKGRLDELRIKLDDSVDALQEYRIKENLIDIEAKGVRSIASSELESLTQSYLAAKQARYEAQTVALFVNKVRNNDIDSLLSLSEIGSQPAIESIRGVELETERHVSELSLRYGAKHPKLVAAKAELAAVQKNLTEQVNKLVRGINKKLTAAKDNERRLKWALEKEKSKFQVITNKEQGYLKLSNEVKSNRNLYDSFLQRYKEMNITTNLENQKAHIVDSADVPSSPVKPRKKLITLLTFVVSFGFGIILSLVLDSLNDSFRNADEIESKLSIRLLGLLPLIHIKRKKPFPLYAFFDDKLKNFSESVRTLRTGVVLSHFDKDHKVVVVTSSVPREGKTTTAVNLAFSMAQVEKTLLIEADMRRPSFTKVFSLAPYQSGLSNVISGTDGLVDSIVHDDKSGLDILSAGIIPPNPLELLSSQKFSTLLTKLRDHYDRIIIDSAPTLAVSDALVLTKNTDSYIYVVRSESTKQLIAKQGVARLLKVNAIIDGVVLNRVNIEKTRKYESYAGYYDTYGYNTAN